MTNTYQIFARSNIQEKIRSLQVDRNNNDPILNVEWIILQMNSPYFAKNDPVYYSNTYDIFSQLSTEEIIRLRTCPTTLFMFNFLWEGHSYHDYNFWELLTLSALRYDIPREKLFFTSSNLKEEISYDLWQKQYYPNDRINVISFNLFSSYTFNSYRYNTERHNIQIKTIDDAVNNVKENQKMFLSLNRRKRFHRIYTIYKIFKSKFKNNTLISYDKLDLSDYDRLGNDSMDLNVFEKLIESSPSILDFSDFDRNWAGESSTKLFDESMISLVSETLFETYNESSLFFSEKTFKPMNHYHPVIIFGQPEINVSLKQIGFKTYDKYFDLSFDSTQCHFDRIDSQIEQLEVLHDQLSMMSISQRVDWLLQDRETLVHNKEALQDNQFNKNKLTILNNIVRSITE